MATANPPARPCHHNTLLGSSIQSTPNGLHYGLPGHVPCKHVAVFQYADCTRYFDGERWTVVPK